MNETSILQSETSAGIVQLILNRPDRRNALSLSLLQALQAELDRIASNPSDRVVVISANGPAFCAGHDLGEMIERPAEEYRELFEACSSVMQTIRSIPQPVIAKVQGMATAAGCQLVAACDLAVATNDSRFATPGVKIGLFCTTPMVPLVRSIPAKVAMEMLLTGQPLSAQRAYEVGLINRVVDSNELDATIDQYCQSIIASSPMTIRIGKEAFYRQLFLSEPQAYKDAVDVMTDNVMKADAQEGMQAFLEKRPPQWTDQ